MNAGTRRMLALAAAGALAAGCSSTTTGAAAPAVPPSMATITTSVSAPRPRTFELGGVDPCDLIPASARPALTLDQPPSGSQAAGSARGCVFSTSSTTLPSFGVFVDTTRGVSGAVGSGRNTIRTETISGFTATLAEPPGGSACEAFVDVQDGQLVSVQASGLGNLSEDQLCGALPPVVTVVLDTLAALQPG